MAHPRSVQSAHILIIGTNEGRYVKSAFITRSALKNAGDHPDLVIPDAAIIEAFCGASHQPEA